jgi:hypothetical protein
MKADGDSMERLRWINFSRIGLRLRTGEICCNPGVSFAGVLELVDRDFNE